MWKKNVCKTYFALYTAGCLLYIKFHGCLKCDSVTYLLPYSSRIQAHDIRFPSYLPTVMLTISNINVKL